ncbi:MAG: hypothetical protein QG656_115, partial [Candidatus Hydrogenedentes bacterium]|nr:hypothetical protein [Candidatus Hydrogenedentota bacterium]
MQCDAINSSPLRHSRENGNPESTHWAARSGLDSRFRGNDGREGWVSSRSKDVSLHVRCGLWIFAALWIVSAAHAQTDSGTTADLRAAVAELTDSFGDAYPKGAEYLAAIDAQQTAADPSFDALRRGALLANPLVNASPLVFVARRQYKSDHHNTETMFQTGEINTLSFEGPGAIKSLDLAQGGAVTTLLDVPEGIARDIEVRCDGQRILFSMRRDIADDYHLYEMNADGSDVRQLTYGSGLTDIDPFYLPNGQIAFSSTREPKYCQCNRHIMANLFVMDADGANIRQIGHNDLFEGHGCVLPDGRILYDRWEYVDRHFGPSFGLWTVNPDGTNHALYYGNNAWSPGGILDARAVPGTEWVIATFGSCHDRPWGALAIVDRRLGLDGTKPIVRSWPADIDAYLNVNEVGGIDIFTKVQPKYEDPYPLSDKFFLCSRAIEGETMGLFLIDVFGNEVLVHGDPLGCYDPMPLAPRPIPPSIPPRIALTQDSGAFYVHDVYNGTGMETVPRGTIKYLRVIEAPPKKFWTQTLWNIDATQAPAMNWNMTINKRILGDAPVSEDGSAYFTVPAGVFLYFQALDENKMMVQSMRSGTMIQPGETTGCVGCHEQRLASIPNRAQPAALRRPPDTLEPWYGPSRDFNYLTEVQPVFDRYCVKCHDYGKKAGETLNLAGDLGLAFNTSYIELRSRSATRWYPDKPDQDKIYVKAVDDGPPEVLPPYAWGSHRSKLVDVIRNGHKRVEMDRESLERIVTWIDLNAVYYGSYASTHPDNLFGRSPLNDEQVKRQIGRAH